SRRRHTRLQGDWSSDVCSSDLVEVQEPKPLGSELVDAWRGGAPQRAAAVDTELAPADVIDKNQDDARRPTRLLRGRPIDRVGARSEERRVGKDARRRWSR